MYCLPYAGIGSGFSTFGENMSKQPFEGKICVLERLKVLIPGLDAEQSRVLEQSLVEEGRAYNSLWLWGNVLVDGHHRYEICQRRNLPYSTVQVYESAKTIEDVEYRMKRDAIGQRNMLPAIQSRFRAEMVSYHVQAGKGKQEAVETVAKEASVSPRQVYRDVERADLIETLDEDVKPITDSMSGKGVKKLAEMPKSEQKKAAQEAGGDGRKLEKVVKTKATENQCPDDAARKLKSLAHQHRDKLVRCIDDYGRLKQNRSEQTRLVKLVQSVSLW